MFTRRSHVWEVASAGSAAIAAGEMGTRTSDVVGAAGAAWTTASMTTDAMK
jgi:hypothetical protein